LVFCKLSLRFVIFAAAIGAGLLAAGCQPLRPTAPDHIKLQLGWLKTGQQAGEFVSAEKGYYAAEGLDVEFLDGGPSVGVIPVVVSGQVTVGINGSATPVLTARNQGLPIRVIGATHDKAAQALTCRPEAGVKTIADPKGKKVGATQTQRANLEALLRINNLKDSVEIVTSGADLAPLVAGQFDCRVTQAHVEPIALRSQGIDPTVLLNYDYGQRQQSDVFIATDDTIKSHSGLLRRFLRATEKGWSYTLQNPEEAARITLSKYATDADLNQTVATIQALQMLMDTDRTRSEGLLSINDQAWNDTIDQLVSVGILPSSFTAADILDQSVYEKP